MFKALGFFPSPPVLMIRKMPPQRLAQAFGTNFITKVVVGHHPGTWTEREK